MWVTMCCYGVPMGNACYLWVNTSFGRFYFLFHNFSCLLKLCLFRQLACIKQFFGGVCVGRVRGFGCAFPMAKSYFNYPIMQKMNHG